jgi:hypothetical protein
VTEVENGKLLQQTPRRCPTSSFWLVVKHEDRQMEVLMVSCSGEQALPVFSGEDEAEAHSRTAGRSGKPPPVNSSPFSTGPARVWGGWRSIPLRRW